jgi:hypothetical protein
MIQLPPGFDVAALLSDFFFAAGPFVTIAFLIGCGFLIIRMLTGWF